MAISALDFGDHSGSSITNSTLFDPSVIDPNKRAVGLLNENLFLQREAFITQPNSSKAAENNQSETAKITITTSKLKQARSPEEAPELAIQSKPELELQLSENILITGWVHDEHGTGVAEQIIQLRSPTHKNKLLEGTSDINGTFTLQTVPAATDYRLTIKPSGPYELKNKRVSILDVYKGMPDLNISMLSTGAGTLGLTIHTTSGYPIKEQDFQLISLNRVIDQQRSNPLGYIEFTNVPATGGRPNLKIRSIGSPIYTFSNLSLTRGQINTSLHTQVHHGEHSLRVKIKNKKGLALTDINAKLTWTNAVNGILSETTRVIDNSRNGRNEIPREQQQASNPERTLVRFTGLGTGEHRLDLIGSQAEASYGEPIIINQYNQQIEITMETFTSLYESLQ